MILIVGSERAARQYASERNLPLSETSIASHDVELHGRGRTVTEIIMVGGWREALGRNGAAHLRVLEARGAKWISGMNS